MEYARERTLFDSHNLRLNFEYLSIVRIVCWC